MVDAAVRAPGCAISRLFRNEELRPRDADHLWELVAPYVLHRTRDAAVQRVSTFPRGSLPPKSEVSEGYYIFQRHILRDSGQSFKLVYDPPLHVHAGSWLPSLNDYHTNAGCYET